MLAGVLAPLADFSQVGKHERTAEELQLRPSDGIEKYQAPLPGSPQPAD